MKCHICNKNNVDLLHVSRSHKPNDKKIEYFNFIKNNYNFNYEIIYELYIVQEKSIVDLVELLKIPYQYIQKILDYYNIPYRNIKLSNSTNTRHNKFKTTCINKYGVDNPSKADEVKDKKKQTFQQNWGVNNIFQHPDFIASLPKIMFDKYGKGSLANRYGNMQKYWNSKSQYEKNKMMEHVREGFKKYFRDLTPEEYIEYCVKRTHKNFKLGKSKLENKIQEVLLENNINHTRCKWVQQKSYDFLIENKKILIEVQGDFWHANPELYEPYDILNFPGGEKYAIDIWCKDIIKKYIAEKYGYKILPIWEFEIKQFKNNNEIFNWLFIKIIQKYLD